MVTAAIEPSAPMISMGSVVGAVMGWARRVSWQKTEPASGQSINKRRRVRGSRENTFTHCLSAKFQIP